MNNWRSWKVKEKVTVFKLGQDRRRAFQRRPLERTTDHRTGHWQDAAANCLVDAACNAAHMLEVAFKKRALYVETP
eukprot:3723186-Pleurochrysis_carterae.AAC.1